MYYEGFLDISFQRLRSNYATCIGSCTSFFPSTYNRLIRIFFLSKKEYFRFFKLNSYFNYLENSRIYSSFVVIYSCFIKMIILSTFDKPEGSLNVLWIENTETFHHHLQALGITHTDTDNITYQEKKKKSCQKEEERFQVDQWNEYNCHRQSWP